jgi:hypothetical protein
VFFSSSPQTINTRIYPTAVPPLTVNHGVKQQIRLLVATTVRATTSLLVTIKLANDEGHCGQSKAAM